MYKDLIEKKNISYILLLERDSFSEIGRNARINISIIVMILIDREAVSPPLFPLTDIVQIRTRSVSWQC